MIVAGGGECSTAPGYDSCINYGNSSYSSPCCAASTAELYEPAAERWTVTGPVLAGDETALAAFGNEALLAGGDLPLNSRDLNTAYVYGPPPPPPPPPATNSHPPSTPSQVTLPRPALTHLNQSNRSWREGTRLASFSRKRELPPLGTTFSFGLNEPASVSFAFTQRVGGRTVGHECVAQTKKNHHKRACKRTVSQGVLSLAGHDGTNKVSFQGRISRSKKLRPGTYTLVTTAADTAGQRSAAARLSFTILD